MRMPSLQRDVDSTASACLPVDAFCEVHPSRIAISAGRLLGPAYGCAEDYPEKLGWTFLSDKRGRHRVVRHHTTGSSVRTEDMGQVRSNPPNPSHDDVVGHERGSNEGVDE